MKVIGIIGAGASGLCALKHFKDISGFTPIIWEKSKVIGGTWVYTDELDKDDHGLPLHSSMYKSLRTNLPKEVMGFPDFPFEAGGESFVHHTKMLSYLQRYAKNYDLESHIQFEHLVENVTPTREGDINSGWLVTTRDLNADSVSTTVCDAILICNGHYSDPHIPALSGIDQYTGAVEHSHRYREPKDYADKTVLVLGASASGLDISLDIAKVAKKVYLAHNHPVPVPSVLPPNLQQVRGAVGVKPGTDIFVLNDGNEVQADALLYCTGYHFSFPFLSQSCGITVEDNQISPLYRHVVHCHYPTMAFIGIVSQICPFPFFDVQVRYFLGSFLSVIELPSPAAMVQHTQKDLERRVACGELPRHYHGMKLHLWQYIDTLLTDVMAAKWEDVNYCAQDGGNTFVCSDKRIPLGNHVKLMFMRVVMRTIFQIQEVKNHVYEVRPDSSFVERLNGVETNFKLDAITLLLKRVPAIFIQDFHRVIRAICSGLYYLFVGSVYQLRNGSLENNVKND